MFDFINISVIDIIDIALVGFLIYQLFKIIRGTAAINIFLGILLLYLSWLLVKALNMSLISSLLGQILGVGVIAIIVLFKQEIRRFLTVLGSRYVNNSRFSRVIRKFFKTQQSEIGNNFLEELTQACSRLSLSKTGALIVLEHYSSLEFIVETGDRIDATINRRLIENIFFKNAPLHDGAMIIFNNKIIAARCTLPITENAHIPPQYGMRHRAAVGITEQTDADVITVSEETGNISFVSNGEIKTINSINELRLCVENSYKK